MKRNIVLFAGKSQAGKDLAARIWRLVDCYYNRGYNSTHEWLTFKDFVNINLYTKVGNDSNWQIKKFAGKIKEVISILFNIDVEKLEDKDFKNSLLPSEWRDKIKIKDVELTYRWALQYIGTDLFRNLFSDDTWVLGLFSDWISMNTHHNWLITDGRFINEFECVQKLGGICIKIERDKCDHLNHISEQEIDKYKNYDHIIYNNGCIDHLIKIIEHIMLLRGFIPL